MTTKNRIRILFAIPLLIILGVWLHFLFTPIVTNDQGFKYFVKPGASMGSVVNDLVNQKIITSPRLFKFLVTIQNKSHELKAGEYLFAEGTTPLKLLKQITTGTGTIKHAFTIVAGWNFNQVREALLEEPLLDHTISQKTTDAAIMRQVNNSVMSPEGQFFPDTYYYIPGSTDVAVLKRAYEEMQEKLKTLWKTHHSDLPYQTQYEALIAASLIEKETQLDHERPIIAGVIVNRLKKNMYLQIDPTVIYGMGTQYNGMIRKIDLTQDTPYNTYIHKGLPPTPIAMPGIESLEAAILPASHQYLYFVKKNANEPEHQFSETLDEHYSAVEAEKKSRQPTSKAQ
jgi:UPF0755 protein